MNVYKLDFLFRNYSTRFMCVAFFFAGFEGKRGAPSQKDNAGKTTMGLFPRVIRADECGRMHSRSALPER